MRDTDNRSKCIAIVADTLVNAHQIKDGAAARLAGAAIDVIERLGFGIIQLPPHDIAPERARRALELVLDQARDYAANGYRIVSVGLKPLPQAGIWQDELTAELNRRGIVLSEAVVLDPREHGESLAAVEQRLSIAVGHPNRTAA